MSIVNIEVDNNCIVKKHKELVQTARYRLSELSIKVVSTLISMLRVDDKDFQEYNLNLKDFKELIGSNSNDTYKQVDKLTTELMNKPFSIGDEKFNWCYYARYRKGEGFVTLKIAPELKPYLLNLKQDFLEYDIKDILSLKSGYIIRFYELFTHEWNIHKNYNKSAKSFTFELELDYLIELFEIPKSYRYNDIKRILEKAQKQFKEKTNISFTYKEYKLGRKVARWIITVKDNNKGSNDILATRHSFIKHIRETYKPANDVFPTIRKTPKGELKINKNGEIYLMQNDNQIKNYKHDESIKIWDWLYELELSKWYNKVKLIHFDYQ